jgi:glycosyltransferase involved in cell wall biosynthesis
MRHKLVVITTHPIQYYAPFFNLLSQVDHIELIVFYTWGVDSVNKFDPDFGKEIKWDIPLLEGYEFRFTKNTSKNPGSHHFFGIINPNLVKEIKEINPDVIWVWGWAFYSHLKVMTSFKRKIPIWFRGDSTLLDEKPRASVKKIIRYLFLKWVYSKVDYSFSVGTNNTAYYKRFGLHDTQIVLAPHAIDNNRFRELSIKNIEGADKLRKELSIEKNQYVMLFVGKFQEKKYPTFFVKVCNELKKSNVIGVMVGAGELEQKLKNISHNVIFQDFQNQTKLPLYYKMADILIMPSLGPGETWGLVINEALACGLPVAGSSYCGGSIDLINQHNGFIFNPNDGIESFLEKFSIFRKQPRFDFYKEFNSKFNYQGIIDAVLNKVQ